MNPFKRSTLIGHYPLMRLTCTSCFTEMYPSSRDPNHKCECGKVWCRLAKQGDDFGVMVEATTDTPPCVYPFFPHPIDVDDWHYS